ncbi:tetratricopeptide repeat protein [Veronia nyctiphanis]|uniref:tetratricopeptide repeat protein n=1 Tax=Veronia nyctiphanis TaxID=1278244 RepID=UPI001375D9FB|nr:tetratricopeptide repeat protein [Veronia nyctiphanis]
MLVVATLGYRKGLTLFAFPFFVLTVLPENVSAASTSLVPTSISAHFTNDDQRAYQLYVNGQYDEAALLFSDPDWRGIALYKLGLFDAAIKTLEGRSNVISQYNLGNAYVRAGEFEKAISSYQAVLEKEPSHPSAIYNLNMLLDALGRSDEKVAAHSGNDRDKQTEQNSKQTKASQSADRENRSGGGKKGNGEERASSSTKSQSAPDETADNRQQNQRGENNILQKDQQAKTTQGSASKRITASEKGKTGQAYAKANNDIVIKKLEQIPDDPSRLLRARCFCNPKNATCQR